MTTTHQPDLAALAIRRVYARCGPTEALNYALSVAASAVELEQAMDGPCELRLALRLTAERLAELAEAV